MDRISQCMLVQGGFFAEDTAQLQQVADLWPLVSAYGTTHLIDRAGGSYKQLTLSKASAWDWPSRQMPYWKLFPQIRYANTLLLLDYVSRQASKYEIQPGTNASETLLTAGLLSWAAQYVKENKPHVHLEPCRPNGPNGEYGITRDFGLISSKVDRIDLYQNFLAMQRPLRAAGLVHETRHWDNAGTHWHEATPDRDLRWVYQDDSAELAFAYSVETAPYFALFGEKYGVYPNGVLHNMVAAELANMKYEYKQQLTSGAMRTRYAGAYQFEATFLANLLAVNAPQGILDGHVMSVCDTFATLDAVSQILANQFVVPPNFNVSAANVFGGLPPFEYW